MAVNPGAGGLLGQLAVSRGLLSPEQLRACVEILGREGNTARLGDILLAQGLLTLEQITALVSEQTALQAGMRDNSPTAPPPDLDLNALEPIMDSRVITKVPIAKKTAQQVEQEIVAQRAAMAAKRQILDARAAKRKPGTGKKNSVIGSDGKIELDLPDDDTAFEIETNDGTREVSKAVRAASDPGTDLAFQAPMMRGSAAPGAPAPTAGAPVGRPLAPAGTPPPVAQAQAPAAPVAVAPAPAPVQLNGRKLLADLVLAAARAMASDLHLHPGYRLMIRQQGRMVHSPSAPLQAESLEPALQEILSAQEKKILEETGQVETTFVVPNVARCRVEMARTAAGISAVFRLLPLVVPNLSALALPTTLARYVAASQGLVLIAGPAACGKTWTLAALVDIVNSERREHVVCIERPIEFLHLSKRCVVTQREVPTHARDMSRAVRAALHEDVDVLVIGEIEDAETVRLAVTAAEGGKLVLATVAASGAARAVARVLGMFPGDQQVQASSMLADALRAVVGQRLVPMADGLRRMPVCEVLEMDSAQEAMIQAGRIAELVPSVTFDEALGAAVRSGQITRDEARRQADHPEPFG